MMELLSGFPKGVVALVWHDKIAQDIDPKASPEERDARASNHDIRVLAKLHDERHGSLADVMRGWGQWRDFDRIAIITDEASVRHAVQFFAPFLHPGIRVFRNRDSEAAREWLRRRDLS